MIDNWNSPNNPNMSEALSNNETFKKRFFALKKFHELRKTSLDFGQWIEQHPVLMKYIEYSRVPSHPLAWERYKAAQDALEKFDCKEKKANSLNG
jgi:hypothetical protein